MNMNSHNSLAAHHMFFQTMGNDTRLHILNSLREKPLNVSEICTHTGYEQTLVSHHLKMLEHHGMVFSEKKGKYKYFTLNQKTIEPLLRLIDKHTHKYCCKILRGER